MDDKIVEIEKLPELPVEEEPSQGEEARETVDDWSYLTVMPRLNRQA